MPRRTALGRIRCVSFGRGGERYELQAAERALKSKPFNVVNGAVLVADKALLVAPQAFKEAIPKSSAFRVGLFVL